MHTFEAGAGGVPPVAGTDMEVEVHLRRAAPATTTVSATGGDSNNTINTTTAKEGEEVVCERLPCRHAGPRSPSSNPDYSCSPPGRPTPSRLAFSLG